MTKIEIDIKLGWVQVAIMRLVKKHNISITEWNLKTERVERVLGHLLWQRDRLLASCSPVQLPK